MPVYVLIKFLWYLYPSMTDNNFAIRELAVNIAIVVIDYSNNDNKIFHIKKIRRGQKMEYLS